MDEIREEIRKHAILNAIQHEGKAQTNSVLSRIMGEYPHLRQKARDLIHVVREVVEEINGWPLDKQISMVDGNWPELLESKQTEKMKTLPPLDIEYFPMVKTRFAPNPDGALHLGSAEPIIFCDEYAKMYNGHFILRYEDTSTEVKPPIPEMYDLIMDDLKWLGVKVDEVYIQSDRLSIYYEYAKRLIRNGGAYICTCPTRKFRQLYMEMLPCPCRSISLKENLERWRKMLRGPYKKGDAVVRIKTDLNHPNPAIRDWPALRISTAEHPRQGKKYRVWPLYNFSCAIDDHLLGISHIIRGKEHEVNTQRQKFLFQHMGWKYPSIINVGRVGLENIILSKSMMRAGIEDETYSGWDDPRLGTLIALRRRGLQPETIREIMIQIGPKPINVMLSWDNIATTNRKKIDAKANRYFFVEDPVTLNVKKVGDHHEAHLPLHPDYPERGTRNYRVEAEKGVAKLYVARKDLDKFENEKVVRLMGLMNVKGVSTSKSEIEAVYIKGDHQKARELEAPLIHWLPVDEGIEAIVVQPDASVSKGLAEKNCLALSVNDMIQFERYGFVRVDSLKPFITYYAHN